MRGNGRVLLAGERGERFLCCAGNERIDADNCVFRRKLLVRHFDGTVLVEDSLEPVDGLGPRKVLNVAPRFGHIPRHHHAILEFLYVTIARHTRLEKNAYRREGVNHARGPLGQRIETANGDSAFVTTGSEAGTCVIGGRVAFRRKPNRSGNADGERIPGFAGKRKREIVQRDLMTTQRLAEVGVPAQWKVFDAISPASERKAKRALAEIEEVLLAECALVQLQQDQVFGDRDFADGLSRYIPFLSKCRSSQHKNGTKHHQHLEEKTIGSSHFPSLSATISVYLCNSANGTNQSWSGRLCRPLSCNRRHTRTCSRRSDPLRSLCSLPNAACSSATLPLSRARSRAASTGPLDRPPAAQQSAAPRNSAPHRTSIRSRCRLSYRSRCWASNGRTLPAHTYPPDTGPDRLFCRGGTHTSARPRHLPR